MKAKKQINNKKSVKKPIILLSIIGVLMILFSLMTVMPIRLGINDYVPIINNISLGIDLKGGVYVVMEAENTDEDGNEIAKDVMDRTLEGTISRLSDRLVKKGYTEATVVEQSTATQRRIRIEIPDVDDPEAVFNIIGKPAVLEFRDESGNVLITGADHLESAYATYDENGSPAVGLKLNAEGTTKFAEATAANVGKKISIYIDDDEVSSPTVEAQITTGTPIITNIGTQQEASDFAMLLQSGSLPLTLNELEKGAISPTLGQDALRGGIIAGIIGLALVMVFISIYYKGFGIVSSISLIIYSLLLLYVLAGMPIFFSLEIIPKSQMTLPGIAGIILSIGMAIDANIIIFERVKDELKIGKSLDSAIKTGFKRAFSAIFDSNLTTFFAGVVLLIFGQGNIKGFASILIIGIILSFFCALVVTRMLLKIFLMLTTSDKFYGIKKAEDGNAENAVLVKEYKIVDNKKKFMSASLAIILAGLLVALIFGLNTGIDFTGGNIISVQIGTELDASGNFNDFSNVINKSIDDYAKSTNLAIDKNTPQLTGTNIKGITVRYNIKNALTDDELSNKNDELNALISDNVKAKMTELGMEQTNFTYEFSTVGGTVSGELVKSAFYSILLAALLMLIYLAFRFEFLMGLASVIALLHDVLIMIAFVAIFRYQINSSFIAAMITIIGYSINATIVIFDRVRENTKRLSLKGASYGEIGNRSIKETIMRSINTSITTLITILILFIVGVPSIKEFAFPIIIGLLAGTYSSIFLSVSIWVVLKTQWDKYKLSRETKKTNNNAKPVKAN